jgi:hypothetical protein
VFKLLAFLTKREGLSFEDFVDHYENRHIPLILSVAPAPALYRRRYLTREKPLGQREQTVDFDAITELWFTDRDTYRAWMAAISADPRVAEDEARFLERSLTRAYNVDERETGL